MSQLQLTSIMSTTTQFQCSRPVLSVVCPCLIANLGQLSANFRSRNYPFGGLLNFRTLILEINLIKG